MSYGIYIGQNHTADGIAYLGGYGDEPSSHWLEIIERCHHPDDATIEVGVTAEADLPGVITSIPQVSETARHIRVSYSYYKGTPAPLTNGGLNEHGVAVRDIWSPSRPELVALTPKTQAGPNYSDLARIVLERARSAVEGVQIIGALIADHGHSTYGGNSHIIADAREAWVVIQFAGGQGLWAAERLNENSIRASRPGYIGDIPVDQPSSRDFLHSPNLVSFAISKDWYNPNRDESFNVNKIYGDGQGKWAGVDWIEKEMARRASRPEKIGLDDVMWAVRTERLTGDTAGYGQVVPLIETDHAALRMIWHTQIGAVAAPFVPVFMGVREIPEEFRLHRYLTDGEAARFLDAGKLGGGEVISLVPQGIEATRSATYIFKRLQNLMFQRSAEYLGEFTSLWEAREKQLASDVSYISRTANILLEAKAADLAERCLTYFTGSELMKTLENAERLAAALELRTRLLHGLNYEHSPRGPEQIW